MILKRLLLICLVAFPYVGFAQIQVTSDDILGLIGTSNTFEFDTTFAVTVDVGIASGQSQTWDFTGIETDVVLGTMDFLGPAGTPFENDFPDANFVQQMFYQVDTLNLAIYNYMTVVPTSISRLGTAATGNGFTFQLEQQEDIGPLPVSYGDEWMSTRNDTSSLIPGSETITIDTTYNFVDAFGTVQLPVGNYECLRLRSVSNSMISTVVGGIPIFSETSVDTSYFWLDKNHFFVASVTVADEEGPFSGLAKASTVVEASSFMRLADMSTSVSDATPALPEGFALAQNYPNPFNPETVIKYQLPADMSVQLTVSNLLGQQVATLVNGAQVSGQHEVRWNGLDQQGVQLPSGIYIYQLRAGDMVETRRMLLLR
jgi:hypothetical protein